MAASMGAAPNDYRVWNVAAGSGEPIVLIHGAFCDYRYWEPQLETFGHTHRAIAVSLRGYHPDPPPAPESFSADQHVADVGAFLTGFDRPACLVGHSRGGRIAFHVAARFPHAVRSLVLVEPGGEMEPDFLPPRKTTAGGNTTSSLDIRREAQRLIEAGDHEPALRLYIDSGHGSGSWDRSPPIFRRVALSNTGTLAGMLKDRSAPLARTVAASIKVPTLLIGAERSPAIFGQILDVLSDCLSRSSRITIANADHFMSLGARDAFNEAIAQSLK
jgi:pimeloyl-ACP methyl ester carboxylesterase